MCWVGLFRDRNFTLLFASRAASQMGARLTTLGLPLAALTVLHASPFEAGLLATLRTLPFLLIGLPAGAWVDRIRRRPLLLIGGAGHLVVVASIPVAWAFGVLTLVQLYVVALVLGVLNVFFDVAYQSYVPFLIGRDRLVDANAKLQSAESITTVAGPTVAGFLVQLLGAPLALAADGVSRLWSVVCIALIRRREPVPERKPGRHLGREIREGLTFVLTHPLLRPIASCTALYNLFYGVSSTMVIVLLADELHIGPGRIGVFFAVAGVGAVVGALVAGRIARGLGAGPAIWLPMLAAAPFNTLVPMADADWRFWLAAAGMAVGSAGAVIYNIGQLSVRQQVCPDELLGRVNATVRFLVWGTLPVGSFVGGLLGGAIGVRAAVWVAALGMAVAVWPLLASPLRTLVEAPPAPPARFSGTRAGA